MWATWLTGHCRTRRRRWPPAATVPSEGFRSDAGSRAEHAARTVDVFVQKSKWCLNVTLFVAGGGRRRGGGRAGEVSGGGGRKKKRERQREGETSERAIGAKLPTGLKPAPGAAGKENTVWLSPGFSSFPPDVCDGLLFTSLYFISLLFTFYFDVHYLLGGCCFPQARTWVCLTTASVCVCVCVCVSVCVSYHLQVNLQITGRVCFYI